MASHRRLADSSAREGTLAEGVVPVTDANVQFSHPCDPAAAVNVTADSSTSSSTGAETHDSPELVNVELPPISGITESVTDHQASLSGLPEHSTLHETEEVVTGISSESALFCVWLFLLFGGFTFPFLCHRSLFHRSKTHKHAHEYT